MTAQTYEAIVIGAGQSGGPLSTALAGTGRRVALIEREHVGGTCVNEGCTPTKTMIASARVAYLVRRAADYGVETGPVSVDMKTVRQRKRDIVESFRSGSRSRIEEAEGVDLLMGEAHFTDQKTVEVELNDGRTRRLTAEQIFINTGTRPNKPPIPGLEEAPSLDSTSIMELDTVPEHLLIIGGGYIGVEFGQMFRRFGSRVTIIQWGEQLLSREDSDVAEEVLKILQEDGIQILLEANPVQVRQEGDEIRLNVRLGGEEQQLIGSHLLLAAGRIPNTDTLNLAATGLNIDKRGYLQVNDRLETNIAGIYAMGDVKGGPAFTHISYDDFRILRTNLLEEGEATITGRMVPYTVFMDPQLGRIGLSEAQARQGGRRIGVGKIPMSYVARALEVDESRGLMKVVVDMESKQILGCAILGLEGGEIMAAVQIAMMGQLPYTALRDGIFAHPTLAESFNTLFGSIEA